MNEPLYNLWYNNELLLEKATWREIECEMGSMFINKENVDIETIEEDL